MSVSEKDPSSWAPHIRSVIVFVGFNLLREINTAKKNQIASFFLSKSTDECKQIKLSIAAFYLTFIVSWHGQFTT